MPNHDGPSLRDDTAEQFLRVWGQVVLFMPPDPDAAVSNGSINVRHPFNQLRLLRELRNGPMTMGQIAQLLGVTNAAVTGIADRLEQSGLVQRTQDRTDRRVVHVRLTPAGDALQGNNHQRAVEWTREVLGRLDADEAATFGALLVKIEDSILKSRDPSLVNGAATANDAAPVETTTPAAAVSHQRS